MKLFMVGEQPEKKEEVLVIKATICSTSVQGHARIFPSKKELFSRPCTAAKNHINLVQDQ